MNKLFNRQLQKLFPAEFREDPRFTTFINAVNNSYKAFERDIELSERAFRLSEMEYEEINARLKEEVAAKKDSIDDLKKAVTQLGDESWAKEIDENDLRGIASILNQQALLLQETRRQQQEQRQFYEHILNIIPANIAVIDKDNRYLFVNPSAISDPEVRKWIIGKTDYEYHQYRGRPVNAAKERYKHFTEVIKSGRQQVFEERIVTRTGDIEYHLRMLHPVYHDNGEFDMLVAYGLNITDRKKIEEQIQRSEIKYRSIFDNSQALICTHDINGKILDVNNAACKTFGYQQEELLGRSISELLFNDKQAEFESGYLKEILTNGKAEGVMLAMSSSGEKIYLLYQNFLVKTGNEEPYIIGFSQDITARIKAERALKASEEKYRQIIENMNLGLVQVTPDETIVYANQSFCAMSGYDIDELIGKNAQSLFVTEEGDIDGVQTRRRSGHSDAYELQIKTRKGEDKWWLISGAPIFNDKNQFTGSIGIHLDISSQKQIEAELKRAKAETEASARAKETFLANMSHEIRTPMNGIIGIGKLLAKTSLDKQQRYYLDIVQNAASNLMIIINDLLDFSKIESGKIVLEHIGFSMKEKVEHIRQMLGYRAEEKGLSFICECDEEVSPILIGDPFRLDQVFMNLLSNALKFTEHGSVSLTCELKESTNEYQVIRFSVSDTGIGISQEFLTQLFDKFTQEDESISRKFGGTGLGMSITRQLIELMGGSIEIDSKKDAGTTMSFTLKMDIGSPQDLPVEETITLDTKILRGKRILLVEDNATNRILAHNILSQYGAEVTEADDGSVAVERMKLRSFDLVLMDMQMPVMNGLEATRYIRAHIDSRVPVVALTASAFKKEEESCLAAGMNDFITKPLDEERLVQRIAHWLGQEIPAAAVSVDKEMAKEPDMLPEGKLFDMATILSFANGDKAFIKHISKTFIKEFEISVNQLTDAFNEKDWSTMSSIAHRIRPSALNFKVAVIVPMLSQLEHFDPSVADIDATRKQINTIGRVARQVCIELGDSIEHDN